MRCTPLLSVVLGACGFSVAGGQASGNDAAPGDDAPGGDTMVIADAPSGSCAAAGTSCSGDVLATCSAAGAMPTTQMCAWGCVATGTAHCGQLVPSGGAVVPADLMPPATVGAVQLAGDVNTMTGSITNLRAGGTGVIAGIGFVVRDNVGIFTFQSLTVTGPVTFSGSNAVAFVARDSISIDAAIELGATNQEPGPGGKKGGNRTMTAGGTGGGMGGTGPHDDSSGGAGGGFGAVGGAGGHSASTNNTTGGAVFLGNAIGTLTGGGGGGGGGGPTGGVGGGGGGAIQLSCNGTIQIGTTGSISAGGAGGAGSTDDGGGGGGAGGAILLEAPAITIAGKLAVNGGGGGGSDGGSDGGDGTIAQARAAGGAGLATGGRGGATGNLGGGTGGNAKNAAGGGGAVGRIRLSTKSGLASVTGALSPTLGETPTTATLGQAVVQ